MAAPKTGDVWSYEYLWKHEHDAGIENGQKPRQTAIAATMIDAAGRTNLFMLAITKTPPTKDRIAMPIPEMERARAGLDRGIPLWIILDEYNHDYAEASYHLDPNGKVGRFSAAFSQEVLAAFISAAKVGRTQKIPQSDPA